MTRVRTLGSAAAAMRRHAADDWPREACGAVFGRRGPAGIWIALRHVRLANVAEHPTDSFEVDPIELCHVEGAARDSGLEFLGVFHSHPNGRPLPSQRDRCGAWPGSACWIAARDAIDGWHLRCFRLAAARIAPGIARSAPGQNRTV